MQTAPQELTQAGIHLPIDQLEALGWHPGERFQIQSAGSTIVIARSLSPEEGIRALALSHLLHHVGDATGVGQPVWLEGRWRVDVFLSYQERKIGTLVFNGEGDFLQAESSTREEMLEAAVAA